MKNIVTHVVSGAIVVVVGVASGSAYHHQNVVARQKQHEAVVAAQKAHDAEVAREKAAAAKKAAEAQAAALAAQKAKTGVTKVPTTTVTR